MSKIVACDASKADVSFGTSFLPCLSRCLSASNAFWVRHSSLMTRDRNLYQDHTRSASTFEASSSNFGFCKPHVAMEERLVLERTLEAGGLCFVLGFRCRHRTNAEQHLSQGSHLRPLVRCLHHRLILQSERSRARSHVRRRWHGQGRGSTQLPYGNYHFPHSLLR